VRRGKGHSQRDLAANLNPTCEAIDHYERCAQNLTLDLMQKLAEALEETVVELFGSDPRPVRAPTVGATATPARSNQAVATSAAGVCPGLLGYGIRTAEKKQAALHSTSASSSNGGRRASQAAGAKNEVPQQTQLLIIHLSRIYRSPGSSNSK
jgi:transcriptional regulator with XRE-family HTH domain